MGGVGLHLGHLECGAKALRGHAGGVACRRHCNGAGAAGIGWRRSMTPLFSDSSPGPAKIRLVADGKNAMTMCVCLSSRRAMRQKQKCVQRSRNWTSSADG